MTLRNTNILNINRLPLPSVIKMEYPINKIISDFVIKSRLKIIDILNSKTKGFIIIIGPCSIHNYDEAYQYGIFLKEMIDLYSDKLTIIMRTYLSKPRSCVGWKGYLYDPDLDGTYNINKGIIQSRKLLRNLTLLNIPCSMEYLDTISPQYFDDLLVWGAIGARTTESQIHRELASAITTPIGFKNNLDGNIDSAINGIKCSSMQHNFFGCNEDGDICGVKSKGNPNCHLILRGSNNGPNYDLKSIQYSKDKLSESKINSGIIIDCSHGNSNKDYKKQVLGVDVILQHLKNGENIIRGIMLESNLTEGKQDINGNPLKKGISITDSCIGIEETRQILEKIYNSI